MWMQGVKYSYDCAISVDTHHVIEGKVTGNQVLSVPMIHDQKLQYLLGIGHLKLGERFGVSGEKNVCYINIVNFISKWKRVLSPNVLFTFVI